MLLTNSNAFNRFFGEDMFDDFFNGFVNPGRKFTRVALPSANAMRTDVKEKEGGYELNVELPGYKKEDVQLELKDGYLTISAETKSREDEKDQDGKYIRRERYYGSCSRSFYVGEELDQEDIRARFEDGILKVDVPKKEAKPEVEERHYIPIEG